MSNKSGTQISMKLNSLVYAPRALEWGQGKILEIKGDDKAIVFFVEAKERTMMLNSLVADRSGVVNPVLAEVTKNTDLQFYKTYSELIAIFKKDFPDGFSDQKYIALREGL